MKHATQQYTSKLTQNIQCLKENFKTIGNHKKTYPFNDF